MIASMITVPTQKLYFKTFTHCIKLKVSQTRGVSVGTNTVVRQIKNRLAILSIPHRTRVDWNFTLSKSQIDIRFSVYLSDEHEYLHMMKEHAAVITWSSRPVNALHSRLLLDKTEIQFKDQLLFNRFRYKASFRVGWRKEVRAEVVNWLRSQFGDRLHGRKGEWLYLDSWNPNLYLLDDMDLTMVRLSLGEHVLSVTRVEMFSDHGITKDQLDPNA